MNRDNLIAFSIFAISTAGFFLWGFKFIPSHHLLLFSVAAVFGIFMAFNIGGNDVANSFGTSVGAKTITIKQALVIAAIFELSGAIFAGGEVTDTIRKGIVNIPSSDFDPMLFVLVMMSSLLSAGLWLFFASKKGLPVSTTHSIVGGIVGASLAMGYVVTNGDNVISMVSWSKIGQIAASWVISPLLGGILSYGIYYYIKVNILTKSKNSVQRLDSIKSRLNYLKEAYKITLKDKPADVQLNELKQLAHMNDDDEAKFETASHYEKKIEKLKAEAKHIDVFAHLRKYIPLVGAFAASIISGMLLFKGLKHLKLAVSMIETIWIIFVIATAAYLISFAIINIMGKHDVHKATLRIFSWLQIFTASAFAFSHGANDIANAIGPFAAILDVLKTGEINAQAPVPIVAMATFGVALIVGLWFLGKEVIQTVGTRLAKISPVTGFSAELGASAVILLATKMGIPVSSTHILIGAVLGIGLLNKDANWGLMKPIALAWIITLPIAAVSSAVFFFILKVIVGI
ncbi:inorganic phosphate transporter [Candidatus Sulfurimonas marisnigri]|uniref:Phosphate transporter n=1 Tax=Candidatus Sulfurimonas marisnigri TaxID=2740405 RepID=A0A7S7M2A0_9BACT|nr:inorganic phosphate transporter [Candidatus Sulfurimonas marisnigri]QOY55610.1 inorganic phosphate transporter [Candidatus Sulfurimonas marisnigri]